MVLNALLIYYRLNSYKSQVFVDMYININNKQIKMVETFTIFICIPLQFFFWFVWFVYGAHCDSHGSKSSLYNYNISVLKFLPTSFQRVHNARLVQA